MYKIDYWFDAHAYFVVITYDIQCEETLTKMEGRLRSRLFKAFDVFE